MDQQITGVIVNRAHNKLKENYNISFKLIFVFKSQ